MEISSAINYDNTRDPDKLFEYAYFNEIMNQLASAITFYLEVADISNTDALTYEALVRAAICYKKLGGREDTVEGLLKNAISLRPSYQEAYFILSQVYEHSKKWIESYTYASLGIVFNSKCCKKEIDGLVSMALDFQKAVAAWWIGKPDESRDLMWQIYKYSNSIKLQNLAFSNLRNIGYPEEVFQLKSGDKFRYPFFGSGQIKRNFSQAGQDLFVLSMLEGKRNGTYLEIGSADPIRYNNTYLLEQFGWTGTSLDIDYASVAKFNTIRKNKAICQDALKFNYSSIPKNIDYLQVDCEPSEVSLKILKKVIACDIRPKIITFEHDLYKDGPKSKNEAKALLSEVGYILVVENVKYDNSDNSAFEDWWVHIDHLPALNLWFTKDILGIDYICKK